LFSPEKPLQDGCVLSTIGEVCTLVNGRAFKPSDWGKEGVPIVRIQNLNDSTAEYNYFSGEIEDKYRLNTGDLLFAWSGTPGTSFGAFVWNGPNAVLNQHIFNVFPKSSIDKVFLKCTFNGRLDAIIKKAHGGVGLRHITKQELEKIPIVLPNKELQMRFVAFSQQSDKSKFELQQAIQRVDNLIKSLISQE